MKKIFTLGVAMISLVGCKTAGTGAGAGGGASSANAACTGGKVDLSKVTGDWIANAAIAQPEGKYPGSQYRVRFASAPAADGTLKATLAWRIDSRPYTGKYLPNALGGTLELLEDMTPETVTQLRKNQDPNQPMRSVVTITPEETGCVLFVSDETITYVGDKDIRKTMLGSLKLAPAAAGAQYSFIRCTAPKTVYFDGKADEGGAPVHLAAGKTVMAKVTREKKDLPECPYSADVFVDGLQVASKVAGNVGKEDNVDAVTWTTQVTVQNGAPAHGVEFQTYADCTDGRKLIASSCNQALSP